MVRTFIVLECDSCKRCYPSTGLKDGALTTPRNLREDARCDGWSRRKLESGRMRELCPDCTRKAGKR